MLRISAAALALALVSGSSAMAQQSLSTPMDGMMAGAMQDFNNSIGQMQNGLDQITYGAMNDPQVQAGYQQFLARGGQQDFYTWAQNYVASRGYTDNRSVYDQQNAAAAAQRNGWAGVQEAERQSGMAIGTMQDSFGRNIAEGGRALQGDQIYTDPNGGQVPLSYMPNAGPSYDPRTGMTYVPNGNGSYTAYDQNGYPYQMPYGQ